MRRVNCGETVQAFCLNLGPKLHFDAAVLQVHRDLKSLDPNPSWEVFESSCLGFALHFSTAAEIVSSRFQYLPLRWPASDPYWRLWCADPRVADLRQTRNVGFFRYIHRATKHRICFLTCWLAQKFDIQMYFYNIEFLPCKCRMPVGKSISVHGGQVQWNLTPTTGILNCDSRSTTATHRLLQ